MALALALIAGSAPVPVAAQGEYVIRAQDVLDITVYNQTGLRTKYTVEPDGTFTFAFIGRVRAAGATVYQLEAELKKKLREGEIFADPQVSVKVEQFRTGKVFVYGAVNTQGPVPLTPNMTIIEALSRAGYGLASEAMIIRTKGATGPVLPGENKESEVIKINLREFERDVENGELSRNVTLEDGDTIWVPRFDRNRIFVTGEVKTPGAYSIPEGTTVLQAITLAGGLTENASTGRIEIQRLVDGKKKKIKAKLDTVVEFGDTIVVRERFF
jgi:polysaccharide biosynthesis/export protein